MPDASKPIGRHIEEDEVNGQPTNEPRKKIAFVLSGGGRIGSVQVGMARALFEFGIYPDVFIGTSVGAINSAYLAGNPTIEGVRELERIWTMVRQKDVFPTGIVQSLLLIIKKKNHLVAPDGLRALLNKHIRYQTLAEARVPCLLMTTDILTGQQILLSHGNVIDAIMASSALPGIYPPVWLNGRLCIDGSISSNTPISVAVDQGAQEIYVLLARYPRTLRQAPKDIVGLLYQSLGILTGQQLFREIIAYCDRAAIHILPSVSLQSGAPSNLAKTTELIAASYQKTREWLANGGLATMNPPEMMFPYEGCTDE